LGSVHNAFEEGGGISVTSVANLRAAICEDCYTIDLHEAIYGKVTAARQVKQRIKVALAWEGCQVSSYCPLISQSHA
jgi:hypothetical protein